MARTKTNLKAKTTLWSFVCEVAGFIIWSAVYLITFIEVVDGFIWIGLNQLPDPTRYVLLPIALIGAFVMTRVYMVVYEIVREWAQGIEINW